MIFLDGAALQLVDNLSSQNPYEAWNMLVQRYDPADIEAYARLHQEFSFCTIDYPYDCPDEWVSRINARLTMVKPSCRMDDMQMISTIINKLPSH